MLLATVDDDNQHTELPFNSFISILTQNIANIAFFFRGGVGLATRLIGPAGKGSMRPDKHIDIVQDHPSLFDVDVVYYYFLWKSELSVVHVLGIGGWRENPAF